MTSPLLSRSGAVVIEGGVVAAHYGDPLREQRLLAEGAGLVDRSDRDVLRIPGTDRLSWLHSITSQYLDRLPDGSGNEALVLSPNGHVEHHLVVAELGGATWVDVEPGTGPALQTFLEKMRFMLRVEPALVTDHWTVLSLVGPKADDVLAAGQLPVPEAPYEVAALAAGFIRACPRSAMVRPWSTSSSPAPSWIPWPLTSRRPAPGSPASRHMRRCGWRPAVRASASRPTTGRSPTSCPGCRPPCTWTRAATAGRRRWPVCTTSGGLRGGWSSFTWTASARCWPSRGRRSSPVPARSAGSVPSSGNTSWA